jgi:hypothetical protein
MFSDFFTTPKCGSCDGTGIYETYRCSELEKPEIGDKEKLYIFLTIVFVLWIFSLFQ